MPQPRYSQIDLDATPFYHCISRCVRRAFLCGEDRSSGRNFDHRKAWVVEKLAELADVFAIRVCSYAVLSNHFHVVLRVDRQTASGWQDDEVVERYGRLFRRRAEQFPTLSPVRHADRVACWRARLADPSWFMRCLNESIARRANREDGCTGRFWEGHFRSQALLDEAGLLTCMSYVDLNPIRAGLAQSLEESDFTSIQQRLEERGALSMPGPPQPDRPTPDSTSPARRPELVSFAAGHDSRNDESLPVDFEAYADLLADTASAVRAGGKSGPVPERSRRTLEGLGIRSERWLETIRNYRRRFFAMVGTVHRIAVCCARTDRCQAKGSVWADRAFRNCG